MEMECGLECCRYSRLGVKSTGTHPLASLLKVWVCLTVQNYTTGEVTGLLFPCLCTSESTGPDYIYATDGSLTGLLHSHSTWRRALGEQKGTTEAGVRWHPFVLIIGYKSATPAGQVACNERPTWLTLLLGLLNTFNSKYISCYILHLNYKAQFLKKVFSA